MVSQEIIDSLREKFKDVHFMIFMRSVEKARTPGELFDILSEIPDTPFKWCSEKRRWINTDDINLYKEIKEYWEEIENEEKD